MSAAVIFWYGKVLFWSLQILYCFSIGHYLINPANYMLGVQKFALLPFWITKTSLPKLNELGLCTLKDTKRVFQYLIRGYNDKWRNEKEQAQERSENRKSDRDMQTVPLTNCPVAGNV